MAILIGIDEAGYGPVLGPLVVAAAVFEVPETLTEADLWPLLSPTVARRASAGGERLCIADSKLLHQGDAGLERLERNVLGTCPLPLPLRTDALTRWLGIPERHLADGEPWFKDAPPELPLAADREAIRSLQAAFGQVAQLAGVHLKAVMANLAQPWRFNRLVARTDNKATVLWTLGAELLERVVEQSAGRPVRVIMDKQGGRTYYAKVLQQTFPLTAVECLGETEAESRYRLTAGRTVLELTIRVRADGSHLPVALASMYAKYVREVFMARFNGWWQRRAADVAPTAGYWTDYQRWAAEMAPHLSGLDLPPEHYIRCR